MIGLTRRALFGGVAALSLPGASRAQETPLRIIFPFAAGGSADALLRHAAEVLRDRLGRPVIVDNRAGGGGRIGVRALKEAPADGSTILLAAGAQVFLQPHLYPDLGYDPFVDLLPLAQMMTFAQALAVGPKVPATTLRELADWLRGSPDRLVYGSPGAGTGAHFAGMQFAAMSGLDMRHVAYRGTPAALPDLLAGRLPVYLASEAELIEQHKAGGLRILATLDARRSTVTPDIPTFRESGFEIAAPAWFAFYAPAGTPAAATKRLTDALAVVIGDPAMRQRMAGLGYTPSGASGEELARLQRAEFNRWEPIVKASGFKPETN